MTCRTDFVSRNQDFSALFPFVSSLVHVEAQSVAELDKSVQDSIESLIKEKSAIFKEPIQLDSIFSKKISKKDIIGKYVHLQTSPNVGRIAALVWLSMENPDQRTKVEAFAQKLAQHVAGQQVWEKPLEQQSFLFDESFTVQEKIRELESQIQSPVHVCGKYRLSI